MPPKGKKGKKKKETGPKRRKLKRPIFSRFDIRLLYSEFLENFHKCDKDSDKLAAIPLEQFAKALRMCGLTPPEKLIALISERMEKQLPLRTPPPSDDEEEEEEDDDPWLEEELQILKELEGKTASQVMLERRKKKKALKEGAEGEEAVTDASTTVDDGEIPDEEGGGGGGERRRKKSRRKSSRRMREEEEERKRAEEEERLRLEEEERIRQEEEEERLRLEEEEKKKKKPKRELKWPYAKKKEEIKKVAKMRIRFKHFCKWAEFEQVIQLYTDKQYTGQDLLWAFMTLDPKWDYELEPTWYYGADEPLVPTDEIDNNLAYSFITGRQERFIEKEAKRFIRLADFRKETFFNYRELVSDMCQEANYDFGVAKKKKKLKLKET